MVTKLERNPKKFDTFELYTKLCAQNSLDITDSQSVDQVIGLLKEALKENHKNLNLVFGKRVEAMFSVVAASLGKCCLIKQEDGGEVYCNENISIPDFRLVLKDRSSFLVEVKNYHREPFNNTYSFTKKYFESVIRYSELVNCPLKFAIYYSKMNWWLLLSPDAFNKLGNRYVVEFTDALKQNEMLTLGDEWLSTTPPIDIYLVSDPAKPAYINEDTGETNFIIKKVLCYCAEKHVKGKEEQKLLNIFALYSSWVETSVEPILVDKRLIGIRYRFEPGGDEYSENGFDHLGQISAMVSNMYKRITESSSGRVIAVDTTREPKSFSILIPEDYKSKELPLWRFHIQADKG
ncbi:hypothetical protein R6Y90_10500 [Alteromonas macleodii]|uniref:hypothetical protein n=1 Tax=Alteromonas macleodii TaxID=28108 RepID=UPI002982B27B|nr:hypothetical protein [Alteromonas macleodii]MDW5285394.1 hypothetical protein [Alteromonas macleodii]